MVPSDDSTFSFSMPPSQRYVEVKVSSERPVVSYVLMGVTIAVFFLQMVSQFLFGVDYPAALGIKVNELIVRGQVWRLITPMFLHDSRSILHIIFNMYALFVLGPGLERYYGHGRFLALYMLSGFAGNVISFLFTSAPSLGSSTAIFGLLGAQGVFLYLHRSVFGAPAQRALTHLLLIAVFNLWIGAMSAGIDNWGHVGGLVGGTLFAWFGGPMFKLEAGYYSPSVADERASSDALRSGAVVGALFALMAVLKIFLSF